jgi:hypothetical protein
MCLVRHARKAGRGVCLDLELPWCNNEGMNTPQNKQLTGDRLNIPSFIVRAVGFAPGDTVYVLNEDPAGAIQKPCLVLLKEKPAIPLGDYAASKDCRIRVTTAMLKKCGLDGESFEIDGDNGKIIVKKACHTLTSDG